MAIRENTLIGGTYRLERRLGEGSMGDVWQARHEDAGTQVAVKLLRSDRSQLADIKARFEREATTTARIRSPHVVDVFDHGVYRGHPYLVMELLEGEDLDERLRREGPASYEATVCVLAQTAEGLHHAHDAGIIHRDLKPANIFLATQGVEEVAKILDFGIAKALVPEPGKRTTSATAMGVILGSPFYMSPEHIEGRWDRVDHRADLWSLAVIAFRMLTGRLPFEAEQLPDLMAAVTSMAPYAATTFRPELPPEADAFFARAFAKDMSYRFESAREVAAALAEALGVALVPDEDGSRPTLPTDEPSSTTPSRAGQEDDAAPDREDRGAAGDARDAGPPPSTDAPDLDPDLDPTADLPPRPRAPMAPLPRPQPPRRSRPRAESSSAPLAAPSSPESLRLAPPSAPPSEGSRGRLGATKARTAEELEGRLGGDETVAPTATPPENSTSAPEIPADPSPPPDSDRTQLLTIPRHEEHEGERTVMLSDDAATAMWQAPPPPDAPTIAMASPPPRAPAGTFPGTLGDATPAAGPNPRLVTAVVVGAVALLAVVGLAVAVLAG